MLIHSLDRLDFSEKIRRCLDYIHALEEERHKIQVFQRELPLCLELVTQAIWHCKQQLSGTETDCHLNVQFSSPEQTSIKFPVLAEFSPTKRASSNSDCEEQEPQNPKDDKNSKKLDWLSSVQLWNQTPDPPAKLELKRSCGSAGAFHPFKKQENCGNTCTSSAIETGGGGYDGGVANEKEEKEEKEGKYRRKPRRIWSPELHRRFLQALQQLGGEDAATPKLIKELMKVDGLTSEEVKSHLQKYRLHIRKPSISIHDNTNNTPRTHQYALVGGILPEYAETTTTSGEVGGATSVGVLTPIASLPPAFRETSASQCDNRDRVYQVQVQSHSPPASSSTSTVTESPEY